MPLFQPDINVKNLRQITPALLLQKGINTLILDVDNTLALPDDHRVPASVAAWLEQMKRSGIKLMVLSNNVESRVAPFASKLGLAYFANAGKPFPLGVRRAYKKMGSTRRHTALVGDQIFTDVLAANLAGCYAIRVEPMVREKGRFMRLKRRLERLFIK